MAKAEIVNNITIILINSSPSSTSNFHCLASSDIFYCINLGKFSCFVIILRNVIKTILIKKEKKELLSFCLTFPILSLFLLNFFLKRHNKRIGKETYHLTSFILPIRFHYYLHSTIVY